MGKNLEAHDHPERFVPHSLEEHTVDLGEIRMNYVVQGDSESPALLLIPAQSESWWGYEQAIPLLAAYFQVFAVDLRGQGRSTWTPGRYLLDNYGNDLVRFIDLVVGRPVVAAGNSSGGVIAAWLAAYAKPGQVRAVYLEDPPLFSSELTPAVGHGIKQGIVGQLFSTRVKWLGDQWSVGDWPSWLRTLPEELPDRLKPRADLILSFTGIDGDEPPQHLKEYDPELARACIEGTFLTGNNHEVLIGNIRKPVLLSHHFRKFDTETGFFVGALADDQVQRARELVEGAGQSFTYVDLPEAEHSMHASDPALYVRTLTEWANASGRI